MLKNNRNFFGTRNFNFVLIILVLMSLVSPSFAFADEITYDDGMANAINVVGATFYECDTDNYVYDKNKSEFNYEVIKVQTDSELGQVKITSLSNATDVLYIPSQISIYGHTFVITELGSNSFSCLSLSKLYIPDTVTTIREGTFEEARVKELYIPSSVTTIETGSFNYCKTLEKIEVDKDNKFFYSEDGFLYTKNGKTLITTINFVDSVVIKEGVETILDYALTNNAYLYKGVFYDQIKDITISSTVKLIGECNLNAKFLKFKGKKPPVIKSNFNNYTRIVVPKSTTKAYSNLKYEKKAVFVEYCIYENILNYPLNKKFISKLNYKNYLTKTTNKEILALSKKITKGLSTNKEKAFAVYSYIFENFYLDTTFYDDSKMKKLSNVSTVLKNKRGPFIGISNLTTELLRAVNIPTVTVAMDPKDGFPFMAINLAYIDKEWHVIGTAYFGGIHDYNNGVKTDYGMQNPSIHFYTNLEWFSTSEYFFYVYH